MYQYYFMLILVVEKLGIRLQSNYTPSINLNNMTFRKKFELSKKKYIIRMAMYTKNKAFVV